MKGKNLSIEELKQMQEVLNSLEKDVLKLQDFNEEIKKIRENQVTLQKFSEEKWLSYYDAHEKFSEEYYSILNQDSLYNAILDCDFEVRNLIKNASEFL